MTCNNPFLQFPGVQSLTLSHLLFRVHSSFSLQILPGLSILLLVLTIQSASAQDATSSAPEPMGIALENYSYPHPVNFYSFEIDGENVRMAYMDVQPEREPNGESILLMHGKNFFGAYWKDVIELLADEGYRVIVPDQIGFGKSSKPITQYSFHRMGDQTKNLLEQLEIDQVTVMGHSMGGMVASRFTLMYPEMVSKLILENPIGLEDYRLLTPWVPVESIYENVLHQTEERIRSYHEAYYVEWKEEYEDYVQVHYRWTLGGEYPRLARVSALTSQMIYEQPVIHEFSRIAVPTLLIIGQEDRTAPGRNRANPEVASGMGYYPDLGKRAADLIPDSKLVEFENVGHTPHFEDLDRLAETLLDFLSR